MPAYEWLGKNRYFEVLSALSRENRSDDKVLMLSEIDLSSVERLRAAREILTGTRPSYTALVVKAVALALRRHPYANRLPVRWPFWTRLVQFQESDVSVAVERDTPGFEQVAFVGTLRKADSKDLAAIHHELRGLTRITPESCAPLRNFKWMIERLPARLAIGLISLPRWFPKLWVEHRGGAVLISSPGKYGVDVIAAAWPWPLGFSFGFAKERPVAVHGQVVVRRTMTLTMSFDRYVMAGAPAARFMSTVQKYLEDAETYLDGCTYATIGEQMAQPTTSPVQTREASPAKHEVLP